MIELREIDDADPALAFSPLVRGIEKTFAWIGEHVGIPLTPSEAFKRVFVQWAASEFDWPGHTEADLFGVNKVLNESDFAPLMVLHDLMIAMKLGRHYKGEFRLTKAGQELAGRPGRIFGTVVPFFLFRINHACMSRFDDAPIRWIVDDAIKFAAREVRRDRRYDGIVLDPPSYGHGAGKEVWRLDENLPELLSICSELLIDDGFVLLTCHSPGWDDRRLRDVIEQALPSRTMHFSGGPMVIGATDGRELPSGSYVRAVSSS